MAGEPPYPLLAVDLAVHVHTPTLRQEPSESYLAARRQGGSTRPRWGSCEPAGRKETMGV